MIKNDGRECIGTYRFQILTLFQNSISQNPAGDLKVVRGEFVLLLGSSIH